MPTLHRILKYTPAVVRGLLVVAWVITQWSLVQVRLDPGGHRVVQIGRGNILLRHWTPGRLQSRVDRYMNVPEDHRAWLGAFGYSAGTSPWVPTDVLIPVPIALTVLIPLATGPFLSFRFRLWHYLAFTALVAIELAYHLRWQE